MSSLDSIETESKLRVAGAGTVRTYLEHAGFRVRAPRVFERNIVSDTLGQNAKDS